MTRDKEIFPYRTLAYFLIFFLPMLILTPFFLAYLCHQDLFFTGYLENPWDQNIYYSFINQAKSGHLLFVNQSTNIPHKREYFHVLFLFMGWVARIFVVPVPAIYLLLKYVFGVFFGFCFYHLLRMCDLTQKWSALGLLLVLWGAGLMFVAQMMMSLFGPTAVQFFFPGDKGGLFLPLDALDRDINVWIAISFTPLIIFSYCLILFIYGALWYGLTQRSLTSLLLAAFGVFLLGFSHSYDLLPLTVISAGMCALMRIRRPENFSKSVVLGLWVCILTLCVVVSYQYYVLRYNPGFVFWQNQMTNELTFKNIPGWILGYGAFALGYVELVLRMRKCSSLSMLHQFLAMWLIVQTLFLCLPITFSARFLVGLFIPLSIHFIFYLKWMLEFYNSNRTLIAMLVLICLLSPTTKWLMENKYVLFDARKNHIFKPDYDYYYHPQKIEAYRALEMLSGEHDVILSTYDISNQLLRFTAASMLSASEHQSLNALHKKVRALFYEDDRDLIPFLRKERVTLVFIHKVKHKRFYEKILKMGATVVDIWSNDIYAIFAVHL